MIERDTPSEIVVIVRRRSRRTLSSRGHGAAAHGAPEFRRYPGGPVISCGALAGVRFAFKYLPLTRYGIQRLQRVGFGRPPRSAAGQSDSFDRVFQIAIIRRLHLVALRHLCLDDASAVSDGCLANVAGLETCELPAVTFVKTNRFLISFQSVKTHFWPSPKRSRRSIRPPRPRQQQRRSTPSDEAAGKPLYLALRNIEDFFPPRCPASSASASRMPNVIHQRPRVFIRLPIEQTHHDRHREPRRHAEHT